MNEEKQVIKISQILEDLENGLKRPEIAEKYGLKMTEVSRLFQHPSIKGKKARKQLPFVIEDDIDNKEIENENQTNILQQIKEVEDAKVENVSDIVNPEEKTLIYKPENSQQNSKWED